MMIGCHCSTRCRYHFLCSNNNNQVDQRGDFGRERMMQLSHGQALLDSMISNISSPNKSVAMVQYLNRCMMLIQSVDQKPYVQSRSKDKMSHSVCRFRHCRAYLIILWPYNIIRFQIISTSKSPMSRIRDSLGPKWNLTTDSETSRGRYF